MPNALQFEISPYLLQHAHNPVNWYPWGEEALRLARDQDRPIFLSIGYAACHWCHVMERETFTNVQIADFLNDHFISIKVDREERPDLDAIYMAAILQITGRGGWPMSVFLTPDLRPFFGGTYYPPARRYGLPGFLDVVNGVADAWKNHRYEIDQAADQLFQRLLRESQWHFPSHAPELPATLLKAVAILQQQYDWAHGGWGDAPKFPSPMTLDFLLLQGLRGDRKSLQMATHALTAMSRGGMYDVIGGGFHRYSIDNEWHVPHFEKMLYDNAQLARVYLHAYLITRDPDLRRTCERTLEWLESEMLSPQGGFYSSLDADSDGEEGKYYTWSLEEIQQVLHDPEDFDFFVKSYVHDENKSEDDLVIPQLAVSTDPDELLRVFGLSSDAYHKKMDRILSQLKEARMRRIRPLADDKVLVFWNALAILAFSEAGLYLDHPQYTHIAQQTASFLLDSFYHEGKLLRSWRQGQVRHPANLEDYAALALALLCLYQNDFNLRWYQAALALTDEMIRLFKDPQGGFYSTQVDQTGLLIRGKESQDNVTPSGNALATLLCLQLGAFTGRGHYVDYAEQAISAFQQAAGQYPIAYSFWLQAIDFASGPIQEVALLWPANESIPENLKAVQKEVYRSRCIFTGSKFPPDPSSPELLHNRPLVHQKATVYVCTQHVCQSPVVDARVFRDQLQA